MKMETENGDGTTCGEKVLQDSFLEAYKKSLFTLTCLSLWQKKGI